MIRINRSASFFLFGMKWWKKWQDMLLTCNLLTFVWLKEILVLSHSEIQRCMTYGVGQDIVGMPHVEGP